MQGRRRHSGHQILVPESLKAKVVGERECFDMQQRVNRQSSGESKACVAVQTGCRDNGHGQPELKQLENTSDLSKTPRQTRRTVHQEAMGCTLFHSHGLQPAQK